MDGDARRGRAPERRAARSTGRKDDIEFLVVRGDARAARRREPRRSSAPLTDRVRVMGSLALSLCHLAAGRIDAVVCLKPSRSVDFAAAQLIVRERGFAIELIDDAAVRGRRRST